MVLKIVDQLMDTCCGGGTLPFGKNSKEEEEIPETKLQHNAIKVPAKKKINKGKFTDKDMKYEVTVWKDLPLKVRKAVKELGYDSDKWDNSEKLPIEHKHWKDLTEGELKAVEVLGWEEEAWEHHYEHHEFKNLPDVQKRAAEALGMNEETWCHWPKELEHKKWDDMAEDQKQALSVFGWHKSEWD